MKLRRQEPFPRYCERAFFNKFLASTIRLLTRSLLGSRPAIHARTLVSLSIVFHSHCCACLASLVHCDEHRISSVRIAADILFHPATPSVLCLARAAILTAGPAALSSNQDIGRGVVRSTCGRG